MSLNSSWYCATVNDCKQTCDWCVLLDVLLGHFHNNKSSGPTNHHMASHVTLWHQNICIFTVQSAQPYYVSFSLANEERINFLASSALFPRSFHALSTIISRLSHATNPTATRNVKFACHSIVPRSPRATGKIASRYTLQPIATCLHFILDQYRIRSSIPMCLHVYGST